MKSNNFFVFLFLICSLLSSKYYPQVQMIDNNYGHNNKSSISVTRDETLNSRFSRNGSPITIQNKTSDDTTVVDYMIGTLADGGRSKMTYTYNKKVKRTSYNLDYWNNTEWIPFWEHTYSYDLMGNMSFEIQKNWNGNQFVNSLRKTFSYDTNNNLILELYESWNGSDLVNSTLYSYTYNFNGNRTSQIEERWKDEQWIINERETYTYDFNGNKISELREIRDNDQLVNYWRGTSSYDVNGNLILSTWETWDGTQWVFYRRFSSSYDSNQNLILELYENMDGNQWKNDQKITYTYDSNSNLISSLFEVWYGYWTNESRKTYVYDSFGKLILGIGEGWLENKWQAYDQWFEFHDSFGNISSTIASTINVFYSKLTNISDEEILIADYSLYQNYPNPFNPSTVINWQLPVSGHTTLKVYDILGNEIETLIDKQQSPGNYSITFNAKNLPSGVYFYRLKSETILLTKKMLLLK